MSLVLTQESLRDSPRLLWEALTAISRDVDFLRSNYPEFDRWLLGKVFPGIVRGERTLVVERRGDQTAAVMILKHTASEKKLCTLRVRPDFESRGLGVRLFESAFDLLGTERPLLSVSESAMPRFERLFVHFGFAQEETYDGLYLPKVKELSFNGLLQVENDRVSTVTKYFLRTRPPTKLLMQSCDMG